MLEDGQCGKRVIEDILGEGSPALLLLYISIEISIFFATFGHSKKKGNRNREMDSFIEVKGARVNNLRNVSLKIPRNKLVVITGVSGSGKSSLAFDTIYAEGQRRYVESLSSYARQFLGRMNKPEVDFINGIPPAITKTPSASSF